MPIEIEKLTKDQALAVIEIEEGQFNEVKAREIAPASLTKSISAFANSEGGDLYIGIEENGYPKVRNWRGFENQEAAAGHINPFEKFFPLGTDFQYEFLQVDDLLGLVLHVQINKTRAIMRASNGIPYIRRGAASLPIDTPEALKRLEYSKGLTSFEDEAVNVDPELIMDSEVAEWFVKKIIPDTTARAWIKKQALIRGGKPTVAGTLLFADEPQACLPKHSGVKIYRYKTSEAEGFREVLDFTPETIEGDIYHQIREAVKRTIEHVEKIQKMGEKGLEPTKYPPETLHEIITNAIIHRDYSIADDVHIRIFDNRIEVQSPGRLPAHVTIDNILKERFARNGALVRILNKFPEPPNKDVGEGLNTAFKAMHDQGLKEPLLLQKENDVWAVIRHEALASPEEAIMDYLSRSDTINNSQARQVTHIKRDHQVKAVFGRMVEADMIEQVPGTRTSNTRYRRKQVQNERDATT
jgi:ATP-dependent DNA helicase RecG